jgi:hypothetical protein
MNNSSINLRDDVYVQRVGEAEIDLGGIVKGYALDEAKAYLDNLNYKHFEEKKQLLLNNILQREILGFNKRYIVCLFVRSERTLSPTCANSKSEAFGLTHTR